ncbi:glucose transporter 4 enhancer factor [Leptinotarsa decemlineata]|uniref:glucose transporter 4 enhancer factor n=1 Tax=Leptinotarsa decemlineata TaxID=7539 RepID=UPI000C25417D|nr:zinc finger protein 395-like [Leptinotarsa decemlineata]
MSTGKRLAKRSIIGTRVCAPGEDGKFYSGVIQAVKTPANVSENNNSINLTPNTRYTVRFDSRQGNLGRTTAEFYEQDLIGPGFQSVLGVELVGGQKCFVTHNGREICGEVCKHYAETDEVIIRIQPVGIEAPFEVQKRLEEVRLLESRKSARLADQDTDFARLADMAGDRKRTGSQIIDVPVPSSHHGSRKRRPSFSQEDNLKDNQMDECNAALVLMSLSCSPHSPNFNGFQFLGTSPGSTSSSASYRSTPSPPPLAHSSPFPTSLSYSYDEGIVMDYYLDDLPRKKKNFTRIVFQCTWPSCMMSTDTCEAIEAHIRQEHLKGKVCEDSEEEFYYTEIEIGQTSPPPTLSHQDMARPFHEDPDYQRQLVGSMRQSLLNNLPLPQSPNKQIKLSPRPNSPKTPVSPRRVRGENKKCRKIYGMDHKDQWCTQCKWKKACVRFGECAKTSDQK